MLKEALVVSLSRNFWDDVWRSRQQVMSRLATDNTVVFVSRPLTVDEAWHPSSNPLRRAGTRAISENLYAHVPSRFLPTVFRAPSLEAILRAGRRTELQRVVNRWRGRRQVLYLWHPSFESYIDAFPQSIVCYHLFDDLATYGDQSDQGIESALARIFGRADLVFVASEELAKRYAHFGNVHWIPNGVDYRAFADARLSDSVPPPDLERVPRPRLGYVGTMRAQIDVELLNGLAGARPEWSIVLVGDVSHGTADSAEFRQLTSRQNVHALGAKGREELPTYMRHLDVGLLPYRLEGAAQFCYPLKMHEYLAAGLPVVSSGLSAVRPFASVVAVTDTLPGWIRSVDDALQDVDAVRIAKRQAVARDNSWDNRVQAISTLIAQRAAAPPSRTRRPPR